MSINVELRPAPREVNDQPPFCSGTITLTRGRHPVGRGMPELGALPFTLFLPHDRNTSPNPSSFVALKFPSVCAECVCLLCAHVAPDALAHLPSSDVRLSVARLSLSLPSSSFPCCPL